MPKPALGRGLGALLGGTTAARPPNPAPVEISSEFHPEPGERVEKTPLDRICPSALQPRKDFSIDGLQELADSIREQGIVQPLIVRARGEGFELIAGERRWRAAKVVGLSEVPVIVREADDRTVLELMLIENLQRENLNAIEEALGYQELIDQFQLTQEEVSTKVGKSRAAVANALRLLKLAPELQGFVRDGRLSVGHAKVLLGLDTDEEQILAAHRVLKEGLSVRQTEELVADLANRLAMQRRGKRQGRTRHGTGDSHLAEIENTLQQRFGTKVHLRYRQGKGAVEIRFFNDDDLQRILQLLDIKLD